MVDGRERPLTHGVNAGYQRGCRCEPCRLAHRAYAQQRYQVEWPAFMTEVKSAPCMDCGVQYPPYVMEFDHRPGTGKIHSIARMWSRRREDVLAEIAKCDLVCANCHHQRTWERNHSDVPTA